MPRTLTVYRNQFTEDDIADGEINYRSQDSETVDCEPDDCDREDGITAVMIAARTIDNLGLSFAATGNVWACDPDGSQIINYGTGMREEVSAHPKGFSADELAELMELVG